MTRTRRIRVTRDTVLFVAGLVGLAYETYMGTERASLLIIFAAMMGLPAFLPKDRDKHDPKQGGE